MKETQEKKTETWASLQGAPSVAGELSLDPGLWEPSEGGGGVSVQAGERSGKLRRGSVTTKSQDGLPKKAQPHVFTIRTPAWHLRTEALDFLVGGASQSHSRSLSGSSGKSRQDKRLARGFVELPILNGARQLSSAAKTRGFKIVLNIRFLNVFIIA